MLSIQIARSSSSSMIIFFFLFFFLFLLCLQHTDVPAGTFPTMPYIQLRLHLNTWYFSVSTTDMQFLPSVTISVSFRFYFFRFGHGSSNNVVRNMVCFCHFLSKSTLCEKMDDIIWLIIRLFMTYIKKN